MSSTTYMAVFYFRQSSILRRLNLWYGRRKRLDEVQANFRSAADKISRARCTRKQPRLSAIIAPFADTCLCESVDGRPFAASVPLSVENQSTLCSLAGVRYFCLAFVGRMYRLVMMILVYKARQPSGLLLMCLLLFPAGIHMFDWHLRAR